MASRRRRHPRASGGRSGISVSVEGADRLQRQLEELSGELYEAVDTAIQEAADAIAEDTRRRVQVDTGNLKRSVAVRTDTGPVIRADIGWFDRSDDYAVWQEFGTRSMPARPALGPAANAEKRNIPARIQAAVRRVSG